MATRLFTVSKKNASTYFISQHFQKCITQILERNCELVKLKQVNFKSIIRSLWHPT